MTSSVQTATTTATVVRPDLAKQLRRGERWRRLQALALVAPLMGFLLAVFVLPIVYILYLAVASPEMRDVLPLTSERLSAWDGQGLPDEETYELLAREMAAAYEARTIAGLGTRLNYERAGFRSTIMKTARRAEDMAAPFKDAMIARNEAWADPQSWQIMKRAARPVTPLYVMQVLDLQFDEEGGIERVPAERSVYLDFLARTFWISGSVTLICVLIAFPLAFYAANAASSLRFVVLGAVLLPFWISVLVRTAAWMIVLQKEGLINGFLLSTGVISQPLELLFNRFSVYIAMIHVLLPFVVMPLYSTMRAISPVQLRAAGSLGASPFAGFWTVYFPQTLPGLSAGALLVFILALGYYITPALVGGPGDQMLSYLVTQFALELGNWGMAAAAAALLLICTFISYIAFRHLLGARGFMA
ncbi:MAG: ABC transporter permease [Roseovarius sp.]|uniref:ABC transporter permease n=1 Tax=Roseovarius sp. TaxID=1486281 RepID=UPI0032EC4D6E